LKITTTDIFIALKAAFAACLPEASHYFGNFAESRKLPAFLYRSVFDGRQKSSYATAEVTKEIQVIFFGRRNGYSEENYRERLAAEAALQEFLSGCGLWVKDRHLNFTYQIQDADEQMAIYLTFRYREESPQPKEEEEQQREAAEHVAFRKKERSE